MIVRFFYYYHLNLIYDSFYWFDLIPGKYDTVDQKLSFRNDILTSINFQVRDLDLQAMGGGGDSTEKKLWTHAYHQTIYESDPPKGLEIMRCSNKVPNR